MHEIEHITPSDYSAWNEYVLSRSQAGPYLSTHWKESIEKGYGHKTYYLAAYKNKRITGILPLARISPPLGRNSLVSLPFCDYGGLLTDDDEAAELLLEKALSMAGELRSDLEIRNADFLRFLDNDHRFIQCTDKCRMILELPETSELLWSKFKSKLRSQIKRPSKEGLFVRLGQDELLPDFYHVFSRNMRDLGSPVHSSRWIKSVIESFGDHARICTVYKGDIPAAAGIILMHANTVNVPWASALKEYNRLSPNMLLYWTFLKFAADNGYRFFDFGRSSPGEGTYTFKQQWGAEPLPLYWNRMASRGRVNGDLKSKSSFRSVGERLWRNLPVTVANTLGPRLRKYIDK